MRTTIIFLLVALTVPLTAAVAQDDETDDSRLQIADYLDLERVADPQISPDGSTIIYTRSWVDKMEDKWKSSLWIMNADGSRNRFLMEGSNARWSSDGTRILYLAEGEPKGPQIYVRWMDAEGASSQITRVEHAPRNPEWSPDNKSIAFVSVVPDKASWDIDMPTPPEGATWTEAPRVVDQLHYRQDRVGFTDPGFVHLFAVTADAGTPRELTSGDWNVGARFDGLFFGAGFDWTPDSRSIIFDGLRDSEGDDIYRKSHIYAVDIGTKEISQLTTRPGFWTGPTVSPDGRTIAFAGFDSTGYTYTLSRLQLMGIDGADHGALTPEFDRPVFGLRWAPDGRGLYFTNQDHGALNVAYADLGGDIRAVTSGAQIVSLSSIATNQGNIGAGILAGPQQPGDVTTLSLKGAANVQRLTSVNDDIFAEKTLAEVEEIWYKSSGDTDVQGWIVKPPDFDESRKYPLIMEIHGGPFAMYGVGFRFNFQYFAAQDHIVLYTNPRGSTGYGEDFSRGIDHAYPSVDYDDLMACVDAVITKGYVDEDRLYVGGCSGGGVLSSWVIGNTNRFAAAAVRCPVINWMSFAGQSDIPFFTHSFFHKPYWEDPTQWLEQSPGMLVGNVTTPTVVMTGVNDLRTPMPQSEEYYAALKMLGVPAKLLRFNDEYHGTGSKPSNYMRTALYMLDWYQQWPESEEEENETPPEEDVAQRME